MTKTDNYKVDFTKLESKVEIMTDKLNKLDEIEITLKEIQKALTNNHVDVELLKKDIYSIEEKYKGLHNKVNEHKKECDLRYEDFDKRLTMIAIKISTIVSVVTIIGWFVTNFIL